MSNPSPVSDRVPVAPLREAFERSGLTLAQVCRRLGWTRPDGCADSSRLKRALGMAPYTGSVRYTARRIGYDHAARIADAIGVDPTDVEL